MLLHGGSGNKDVQQKIVCVDPSLGITLLLVLQFGQTRMFLKDHTMKVSILYILRIGGPVRDSNFRQNLKHIATVLEMKSDPTSFSKTVSKGSLNSLNNYNYI